MSKISSQQAFDRLATLAAKINKYFMTVKDKDNKDRKATIQTLLQEAQEVKDLVGSYADDVDGNLDQDKSVVENLSIAVSNITAILNREKDYATKQEVTDGDTTLQKQLDVINSAGVHIPHYDSEASRDRAIPNPTEAQVCYVGANTAWVLNTYENGAWVKGFLSQHSTSALPVNYEEKEITITPAVYGWKEITNDYQTRVWDNDFGKKIRVTTNNGELFAGIMNNDKIVNTYISSTFLYETSRGFLGYSYQAGKSSLTGVGQDANGVFKLSYQRPIIKFEIWDIITPAVKATALVKK